MGLIVGGFALLLAELLFAQTVLKPSLERFVSRRMGQFLHWRQFRAILAIPAALVACVGLSLTGLLFFFWGLFGFNPLVLLVALFLGSVMFALGNVLHELFSNQPSRASVRMRVTYGLILSLWLAVAYPLAALGHAATFFAAKLFLSVFSDGNPISELRLRLIFLETECVTAVLSVWLFIELVLSALNAQPSKLGPARGYAVLALLVQLAGAAAVHVALDRSLVARFMASPDSLQFRALREGTIGQALCQPDFAAAEQRIRTQGTALRDDELIWIMETCVMHARQVIRQEDAGQRTRAISLIAPLIVKRGLAIDVGDYCGQGAAELLQNIYREAFFAENVVSAKEGGLQIDCLKRQTERARPDIAEPIWWEAVENEGQIDATGKPYNKPEVGLGDANDGKERLRVLKQLGVDLRQYSSQGRNLLSRVNAPGISNAWIAVLVDEGLDPHQPSFADEEPLSVRLLYRRYLLLDPHDAEAAARISTKVGDPSTEELLQELHSRRMARALNDSSASDEQRADLLAWVADRIDPNTLMTALRIEHVEEGAGPKLRALIDELASKEIHVPTAPMVIEQRRAVLRYLRHRHLGRSRRSEDRR